MSTRIDSTVTPSKLRVPYIALITWDDIDGPILALEYPKNGIPDAESFALHIYMTQKAVFGGRNYKKETIDIPTYLEPGLRARCFFDSRPNPNYREEHQLIILVTVYAPDQEDDLTHIVEPAEKILEEAKEIILHQNHKQSWESIDIKSLWIILNKERLRRFKGFSDLLIETIEEGIVVIDPSNSIIFVNPAFTKMLDYKEEEMLGKSILDFIDSSQHGFFEDITNSRYSGSSRSSQYELYFVHTSGHRIDTMVSGSLLEDKEGNALGSLKLIRDISSEKKLQQTLKASEKYLKALLQSINHGILTIKQNRIMWVNSNVYKILGFSAEDLVGDCLDTIFPSKDEYMEYEKMLYENLKKKGNLVVGTRLKTKDNRTIDVEISASIVQQDQTQEILIEKMELIILIRDLSKRQTVFL